MNDTLLTSLKKVVKGAVKYDSEALKLASHDASIFEVMPQAVVEPEDSIDIKNLVKFVIKNLRNNPTLSLTPRAAGTDMSGGPLSESIVVSMGVNMNKVGDVIGDSIAVQPGAFYRDFEKKTVSKNMIFPSYPVSKEICQIGGIIGNNSGGEKSLGYGKTDKYVKKLKVVLSDGEEYEFTKISLDELKEKMSLNNFEGDLYRNIYRLVNDNYDLIQKSKPTVSKNSSGYALWDVYDKDAKTFDLTKLFTGSQGTLGIITDTELKLVPVTRYAKMLVIYLHTNDFGKLGDIINHTLPLKPESFETYDDNTLKLAVKYFSDFGTKMGISFISSFFTFLPEIFMVLSGRTPKLTLQAEFTGNNEVELDAKINELKKSLLPFNLQTKVAGNIKASKKYWLIRRESFALLKNKIKDLHASPFIDDIIVEPKYLEEFLPKINSLIEKYPSIIATLAGHIGDGNFHIIPLVKLEDEKERHIIKELGSQVFDLVGKYHGSTSGEHNDGLIRTPYLKNMWGATMLDLFVKTKQIFDPLNIFNPGKKTNVSMGYMMSHIRTKWN